MVVSEVLHLLSGVVLTSRLELKPRGVAPVPPLAVFRQIIGAVSIPEMQVDRRMTQHLCPQGRPMVPNSTGVIMLWFPICDGSVVPFNILCLYRGAACHF